MRLTVFSSIVNTFPRLASQLGLGDGHSSFRSLFRN